MEPQLEKLEKVLSQLLYDDYILIIIGLVLIILSYLLIQSKKKLRQVLSSNVKVFQKAFDVGEDGVLILSDKNKVIYANTSMKNILGLKENFLNKVLKNILQIKVKKTWVELDTFLEEHEENSKVQTQTLSLSHTYLKVAKHDELPAHLTIDIISMGTKHKESYKVLSVQDLSKIEDRENQECKHKLTGLSNQIQALKDFNRNWWENIWKDN